MSSLARIFFVALLAVFAAGSVGNAANATTMAVKMALADTGTMDMATCTDCDADGGDDDALVCDFVCTAPFVADLSMESAVSIPVSVSTDEPTGVYDFAGRTGPPDPYPPRTLI